METLGFDEYLSGHTDGLQILRYQNAQAYIAHHDYLQVKNSKDDPYDYDSAKAGGNRFATILLYMTDLGEKDGGETVFEEGLRPGFSELPAETRAVQLLRESGDRNLAILEKDSWEETMTAMCRSRLSVQPREGRAVLFYSQLPNGEQDKSVLHGGCPVLNGKCEILVSSFFTPSGLIRCSSIWRPRYKVGGEFVGVEVSNFHLFNGETCIRLNFHFSHVYSPSRYLVRQERGMPLLPIRKYSTAHYLQGQTFM
jgi:2OG-Fe(II) oxygenase superfamily